MTHASCDDDKILIERFGEAGATQASPLLFTVYNESDAEKSVRVRLDAKSLGIGAVEVANELVTGQRMAAGMELPLTIGPGDLRVIALQAKK